LLMNSQQTMTSELRSNCVVAPTGNESVVTLIGSKPVRQVMVLINSWVISSGTRANQMSVYSGVPGYSMSRGRSEFY
jgi:hypothetical protein